jgi:hypothetical protein
MKTRFIIIVVLLGATYYLIGKPPCPPPGNIQVLPGESVQQAIDRAREGDTITLHDGVYHEKIVIYKSIVLRALNGGEATLTNRYAGIQQWHPSGKHKRTWSMKGINWPVHWLFVDGIHAFDYRSKDGFERQECGPYWSKGWQEGKDHYPNPPIYFARDSTSNTLWLRLDDDRNPNRVPIDFNSPMLDDTTYAQKDLGAYWNQQEIVTICRNPSEYPVTMWNGGDSSRIMKLVGTGRTNDGVKFIHNTYMTGSYCSVAPFGPKSIFENNIVISACKAKACWSTSTLGPFFPTRYNLCQNGEEYMSGFEGITADPLLGRTPSTFFSLQLGSPAIDAGIRREGYFHENFSGKSPDLGAVESNEDIRSWRDVFGHCGPTWIDAQVAALKAPNRPTWPAGIDQKWGGLD